MSPTTFQVFRLPIFYFIFWLCDRLKTIYRSSCRYSGHFDLYCFERHYGMLRGQINNYVFAHLASHNSYLKQLIQIKMATVSAIRSIVPSLTEIN